MSQRKLIAEAFEVGISSGTLAMVIKGDGKIALDASGSIVFNAGARVWNSSGSVRVKFTIVHRL